MIDGAIGVAAGVVLYYAIYPPICSVLILREGGIGTWKVLELYVMPLLFAGTTTLIAYAASFLPMVSGSNIAKVAVISVLSGVLYPLALYVLRRDVFLLIAGRFSHPAGRFGKKLGISPV